MMKLTSFGGIGTTRRVESVGRPTVTLNTLCNRHNLKASQPIRDTSLSEGNSHGNGLSSTLNAATMSEHCELHQAHKRFEILSPLQHQVRQGSIPHDSESMTPPLASTNNPVGRPANYWRSGLRYMLQESKRYGVTDSRMREIFRDLRRICDDLVFDLFESMSEIPTETCSLIMKLCWSFPSIAGSLLGSEDSTIVSRVLEIGKLDGAAIMTVLAAFLMVYIIDEVFLGDIHFDILKDEVWLVAGLGKEGKPKHKAH